MVADQGSKVRAIKGSKIGQDCNPVKPVSRVNDVIRASLPAERGTMALIPPVAPAAGGIRTGYLPFFGGHAYYKDHEDVL